MNMWCENSDERVKCVRFDRTTAQLKLNRASAKIIESSDVIFSFYGKMIKAKGIQYFKRMSCANGIFDLSRGQQIEDIYRLSLSFWLLPVFYYSRSV